MLVVGAGAVDSNQQGYPSVVKGVDGVPAEPVALSPGWHAGHYSTSVRRCGAKRSGQQGGRGDAVSVVVPEDGDRLPTIEGTTDALHRAVHVWEEVRVRGGTRPSVEERVGGSGIAEATAIQHLRQQRIVVQRRERRRQRFGVDPARSRHRGLLPL